MTPRKLRSFPVARNDEHGEAIMVWFVGYLLVAAALIPVLRKHYRVTVGVDHPELDMVEGDLRYRAHMRAHLMAVVWPVAVVRWAARSLGGRARS